MEQHHSIMDKIGDLGGRTYRQTTLNPINAFMVTGAITKTVTLATTSHKPMGGLNKYVWFVYGPLTVCNHTQEKVSGSMNFDQLNMIHTNQSTK